MRRHFKQDAAMKITFEQIGVRNAGEWTYLDMVELELLMLAHGEMVRRQSVDGSRT